MADQKVRTTTNTRLPNYHEIYSNNCLLRISNWDFFLEFGKVVNITEDEIAIASEVGVFMSPQQAKTFVKVISENLATYEKTFGEIAIEPK
jgi:Protein of unknown function (DUF3467)